MSRAKPGPIQIPNCVQVNIRWYDGTKYWVNTLHGNFTGASLPTTIATTLLTGFKSALTSSGWGAQLATSVTLDSVWVKDLRQINLPWILSTGAGQPGTGTGAQQPASLAICVTQQTAKAGAQWRGRSYLSGFIPTAIADPRHHSGAAGTAAKAFIDAVNTTMTTNSMPLCIAQRELVAGNDSHGNPLAPRAAHAEPVTQTAIVSTRLDSQRRRTGR